MSYIYEAIDGFKAGLYELVWEERIIYLINHEFNLLLDDVVEKSRDFRQIESFNRLPC